MRLSSLLGPAAADFALLIPLWPLLTSLLPSAQAINFDAVPVPKLDLKDLGRVGLAGDFDAISLYTYAQQNENGFNTNGSQSVITRLPNGAFATLASADAYIQAMCPFTMKGGQFAGVVVGGNFTSLGGIEAQGVAMIDPNTGKVTPLPGLSGKVSTLFCDEATNTVYVGGEFKGANSTNAIIWVGMTGWANLPFAGFNGPVTSISKESNGNIVFGGAFDGLGNNTSPRKKDQQVVSISSANIVAESSTTAAGFSDPKNIVCKTDGKSGPGNTWLLADEKPGLWKATFQYGFRPTKLRIWNTNQDGRGTKTFRFTRLPDNGIMNMTFIDPATGQNQTCDARCPLSNNASVTFQDFTFVNVVGMSSFQLDISEWYGKGGGLNGIELFQDDIYTYAINDFNEPACAKIENGANATSTGPWAIRPSGQSSSQYLMAQFNTPNVNSDAASVVFTPDLKQSGNYSVTVYTPGCKQDNTCAARGRVNITGTMSSGTRVAQPVQTEVFQTNDFDKYDQIYNGYVEANSANFRPTVTLTPSSGQAAGFDIVAQRVRFELLSSTGGLNGLYEFNPNQAVADTDFSASKIDEAGSNLTIGAQVNSLAAQDGTTYIAGNFSATDFQNIFALKDNVSTALPGGGINGEIFTTYVDGSSLYVGGNFTNTSKTDTKGLNNLAVYSMSDKSWAPLGAGVNGRVLKLMPILFNVTATQPENVVAVTGDFDQILPFGNNAASTVQGLAIWVPSKRNWLQFVDGDVPSVNGQVSASIKLPGGNSLYAGTLASRGRTANDAVTLRTSGDLGINPLPIKISRQQQTLNNVTKRADTGKKLNVLNVTGVVAGFFHENNNHNVTILGGHFAATASNGSTVNNLLFINGTNSDKVTGLGPGLEDDSVFWTLAVQQDTLYAGGFVEGDVGGSKVDGLILYDLAKGDYIGTQPPAFGNGDLGVAVYGIAAQPNTANVYVGGRFATAGSLDCPAVCVYNTQSSQWNRPGVGLGGMVWTMAWSEQEKLVVGGNLTLNGTVTYMATYDSKTRSWGAIPGAEKLPGMVTAMSPADGPISQFWVAGVNADKSAYLMLYDGKTWQSVENLLGKTTIIRGVQVLSLDGKSKHGKSDMLDDDQTLLVTGELNLPSFGNASSALFNGTTFTPFILSNNGNKHGSLWQIFSQKPITYKSKRGHLAVGFVVLIALAIALALIFILVVIGIIAERIRRKREGYMPAPTNMFDKNSNMDRIPPQHLFGNLSQAGRGPGGAPMI